MGYEDNMLANIDRQRKPDDSFVIKNAHEKAQRVLSENLIDPANFTDLYGEENVAKDLAEVSRLEDLFKNNETQMTAEVMEAIFFEQSELSDWLGPHAETIKTSKYDDYINGVDLVAEFDNGETHSNHLALAVDITFGSATLGNKFERIKKEILADKLAQVKYFESHGFKGTLLQIPRVVIGVENDRVKELAALWNQGKKKDLSEHPVRDLILKQISSQLEEFLALAIANNSNGAIKSYRKALQTVGAIMIEQGVQNIGELVSDKVWLSIQNSLTNLKN